MTARRVSKEDVEDGLTSDTSHIDDQIPNSTSVNVASMRLTGGDSAHGPTGVERHKVGTPPQKSEIEKIGLTLRLCSDSCLDDRRHYLESSLSHFSLSIFPEPPRMMERISQSRPFEQFSCLHMELGSTGTQYIRCNVFHRRLVISRR